MWKPYLVVYIEIISHKFSPSPYFNDYSKRIPIHNRIKELSKQGLGYRKIHRVLVKEKWNIGKSPTTVDHMINKMDRRDRILNQKDVVKIVKVDIELFKWIGEFRIISAKVNDKNIPVEVFGIDYWNSGGRWFHYLS